MQLVRYEPEKKVSWKNGGGRTREIAVHPPAAGLDQFAWRVSVAEIVRPGPFSHFAEVDRQLMLLDGAGLSLQLPQGQRLLSTRGESVRFAGETPVTCTPLSGPCLAFNVMTRRGRSRVRLETVHGSHASPGVVGQRLFFVVRGRYEVIGADGSRHELNQYDACAIADGDGTVRFEADADAVLVEAWFRF